MSGRPFFAAIALAILATSTFARAQSDTTLHALGTASIGYTDNMFGAPSDPEPQQAGPVDVWFLELSPGLRLIHDSPRALQMLTYMHPLTLYLGHSDATQHSDVGTWNGIFSLSPRDELILGLSVERSNTQLANFHAGANQSTAASRLMGDNILLQSRASQTYTREVSAQWRVMQTAGAATVIPLDVPTPQPYRYEVNVGASPEYTIGRNAFSVLTDATYFLTSKVDEGGIDTPSMQQVVLSSMFRWRYDLTETWSTEANLGMAGAMRVDPVRGGVSGPTWLGAIRYANEGYDAALSLQRALGPDLLTANTVMADHVLLSGGMPIHSEYNIVLRTGTGYSHSRTLQVEESGFLAVAPFATPKSKKNALLITTYDTFVLDASLGWYPEDLPYVELRYQHLEQVGEKSQLAPAATFHRNMGMLTMGMQWPSRETPRIPQSGPTRVDNTDRDNRIPGSQTPVRGTRPRND